MSIIGNNIEDASAIITNGGIVGIPTETVYGLAANAFDAMAVVKIFEAKKRPFFDPLIVHTSSIERIGEFVDEVPELVTKLFKKFAPGPLTILLKKKAEKIPDIVTAGLDTVAVRIPNHRLTLELLSKLAFPLAAPSANPFGYVSPTTAQHVNEQLGNDVPYILDGGPCEVGIESTIISIEGDKIIVHRLGGISVDELKAYSNTVELQINASSNPVAPGTLESHYAPHIKTYFEDAYPAELNLHNVGYIGFDKKHMEIKMENQFLLSPTAELAVAARNLFAALRQMDKLNIEAILVTRFPQQGLGLAINDRLNRAVSR